MGEPWSLFSWLWSILTTVDVRNSPVSNASSTASPHAEPESPALIATPMETTSTTRPIAREESLSSLIPILSSIHDQLLNQTRLLEQLANKSGSKPGKKANESTDSTSSIGPERTWSRYIAYLELPQIADTGPGVKPTNRRVRNGELVRI